MLAIRSAQAGWSGDEAGWYSGLVCGWLVLLPFAGYALWRAHRQRKTAAPGSVESVQEPTAG